MTDPVQAGASRFGRGRRNRNRLVMTEHQNSPSSPQQERKASMPRLVTPHSLSQRLRKLALPIAVAAITAAATNAVASTLTVIPIGSWGTQYNEHENQGRAITPDGKYVVGIQYNGSAAFDGFLYNLLTATMIHPVAAYHPEYIPDFCTGVGYRTSGAQQLIIDGAYTDASNSKQYQANWMTF